MLIPRTVGQVARYADGARALGPPFFNRTPQDEGQRVPCLSQVPVGQQLHRSLDISEHRRALRAFLPGAAQEARSSSVRCRGGMPGASTVEVPAGGVRQQSSFRLEGFTVMAKGCSGRGCLPHAGHFEARDFLNVARTQAPSRLSC
jgi:hypothetical protein